jgi:hypothetical protein
MILKTKPLLPPKDRAQPLLINLFFAKKRICDKDDGGP